MSYLPRCTDCGRFGVVDELTRWGHSGDLDEPEPSLLCARCAEDIRRAMDLVVQREGIPLFERRSWWRPPSAYWAALAPWRGRRRHGLWAPPERHELVRRESGPGHWRAWCRCGWSTGWRTGPDYFRASDLVARHARPEAAP